MEQPPPIDEFLRVVSERFVVREHYLSDGDFVFIIDEEKTTDTKQAFEKVYSSVKALGYLPLLRKEEEGLVLRIVRKRIEKKRGERKIFLVLLIATLSTVFIDGYLRVTREEWQLVKGGAVIKIPDVLYPLAFVSALFGIILFHELGHFLVLRRKKIESSPPLFIPGIPLVMPTFGAVILQKEPVMNRDHLLDMGISGPIAGLLVTIAVTVLSLYTVIPLTPEVETVLSVKGAGYVSTPMLFVILARLVRPELLSIRGVFLDPIGWAAIVGMFVTFLNALPAWELDGGHVIRAAFGRRIHELSTMLSIILMAMLGFVPMAILILFLWYGSGKATSVPLDDYSPISTGRKILLVSLLVIAILCMPLPV